MANPLSAARRSLSDPATTLEAYTKTKNAKLLALDIVRRGAPMTLHYRIQR